MVWVGLLIAVLATGSFLYFYLPYRQTPEKRWRDAVVNAYRAAATQVATEARELQRLRHRRETERQVLAQQASATLLRSISVRELEAYPGIGPATVGRLLQAGFKDLATLRTARIRIKGLGQKRLTDVRNAVRALTREAEGRFQAGASREAQELEARLHQLGTKYAELEARAQGRANGAAEVVRQLETPAALARQVRFWSYLKNSPVAVPPDLLHRPLPDLRTALHSGEQQALLALASRPATGSSPPGSKSPTDVPAASPASPAAAPVGASPAPAANGAPNTQASGETAEKLLETTVAFAFAVARTDGAVSRNEKAVIDDHFQRLYANDPAMRNRTKAYCAHYETIAIDVDTCIRWLKDRVAPAQRENLLQLGCMIADASGPMNPREARLIERIAREWDVPWTPPVTGSEATQSAPGDRDKNDDVALIAVPQALPTEAGPPVSVPERLSPPSDPRAILEIEANVPLTAELVRRHYTLLATRLAPERAEAMGPEFLAMALSKRQAIRAAAEILMEPFGQPLELPETPASPAELRHNPDLDAMFGG